MSEARGAIRKALARVAEKPAVKQLLVEKLVATFNRQPDRWAVWEAIKESYPSQDEAKSAIPLPVRETVAVWRATELRDDLEPTVRKFHTLAVSRPDESVVKSTEEEIGRWLGRLTAAGSEFGPDFAAKVADPRRLRTLQVWHDAATRKPGDTARLKGLLCGPADEVTPDDAAALVLEYFRLVPDGESVDPIRQVRDAAKSNWPGLPAETRGVIEARYQTKLAGWVKRELTKDDPDYGRVFKNCGDGTDPADGWAAAADLEDKVRHNKAPSSLPASGPTADQDLGSYRQFLRGWFEDSAGRAESAANAMSEAYSAPPPDSVLRAAFRRAKAADTLLHAASTVPVFKPQRDEPELFPELDHTALARAKQWLQVADTIAPTKDAYRSALHALAAGDKAAAKTAVSAKWWSRLTVSQRIAICRGTVDPANPSVDPGDVRVAGALAIAAADRIEELLASVDTDSAREHVKKRLVVELAKARWVDSALAATEGSSSRAASDARVALLLTRLRLFKSYTSSDQQFKEKAKELEPRLEDALNQGCDDARLRSQARGWLAVSKLLDMLGTKDALDDPWSAATRDRWSRVVADARAALADDPGCEVAHRALAFVAYCEVVPGHGWQNLIHVPPRKKDDPLYEGADPWAWGEEQFNKAGDYKRLGNPNFQQVRASYLFLYANHLARTSGTDDAARIRGLLQRARGELENARADGDTPSRLAAALLGSVWEDIAWLSPDPDRAAFDEAIRRSEAAASPARTEREKLARLGDAGRAAYRAAVFLGAGREEYLGKAESHLRVVAESADAANEAVPRARYELAKTYLALSRPDAAAEFFAKAAGTGSRLDTAVPSLAMLVALKAGVDAGAANAARAELDAVLEKAGRVADLYRFLASYADGVIAAAAGDWVKADVQFKDGIDAVARDWLKGGNDPAVIENIYFDLNLRRLELHVNPDARASLPKPMTRRELDDAFEKLNRYSKQFPWYVEPPLRSRATEVGKKVKQVR